MKLRNPIFAIVFLCSSILAARAQPVQVTFTSGEFERGQFSMIQTNGTFHFVAPNTDVNGTLVGAGGSGTYASCDLGAPRCIPGSTFTMLDNITGSTALRQNMTPVVVNGTTYQTMFYNGSNLRLDAGTVRIPWGVSKRKTFQLTFRVHATGFLAGNSPGTTTRVMNGTIDLWGYVTVHFTRDDSGRFPFPSQNYLMTGNITYTFPAPVG